MAAPAAHFLLPLLLRFSWLTDPRIEAALGVTRSFEVRDMSITFNNNVIGSIELPDDAYGVHVSNEMDARRLHYLVEVVGERKIRTTVIKYNKRFPGSSIYVSSLLQQYRVKVPTHVYAPVNVPIYRLYLLCHCASHRLKIGCSGNWYSRIFSFTKDMDFSVFDLDKSLSLCFHDDKCAAYFSERLIKERFSEFTRKPPASVPYGAGGHGEWFCLDIYEDVLKTALHFSNVYGHVPLSLRDALAYRNSFLDGNIVIS